MLIRWKRQTEQVRRQKTGEVTRRDSARHGGKVSILLRCLQDLPELACSGCHRKLTSPKLHQKILAAGTLL